MPVKAARLDHAEERAVDLRLAGREGGLAGVALEMTTPGGRRIVSGRATVALPDG